MVFTDPPYNVSYGAHGGKAADRPARRLCNDALPAEEWERFCQAWAAALTANVAGALYVCMSSKGWPLVARVLAEAGAHWSDTIIWAKDHFVLGRADYQRQYEPVWYGWPDGSQRHWAGGRFEALEPLRQGLREHFGGYGAGVATGLALRHDHGSQYMSDHFQGELRFLGIRSSPSFVAAPEGNGCAERFIRTLKEQLLWVETFETVEQLRLALLAFKDRYNEAWLVERHGHRTPAAVRQALSPSTGAAA